MTERSITDEWLSACDFKWRQSDRQPNKHWALKINIPDDRYRSWNTVAIEVQRNGWENEHGEYLGDAESWMLWVTDTFGRTAFLGIIRWQKEIIGLAEIISKRAWDPKTHIYGQAWPEGSSVLLERRAAPTTPVSEGGDARMSRDYPVRRAKMEGFAIVGPVSSWDRDHADSIRLFNAQSTFGATAGEAWSKQIREDGAGFDPTERSRRVQHWHDRGYRLVKATLTIEPTEAKP